MLWIKKMYRLTLIVVFYILIIIFSLFNLSSCSDSKNRDILVQNSWNNKIWKNNNVYSKINNITFEAVVRYWIDGDTLEVNKINDANPIRIRVKSIDTPEINHEHQESAHVSSDEEYWGIKSTNFAKNLMPPQSHIKIVGNSHSFNRLVCSVFFGSNFDKNFEIEILKAGLALPNIDVGSIMQGNEYDITYYIGLELANAYNYAKINLLGLWSINDLSNVIKVHGTSDYSNIDINNENQKNSIYNIWKHRNTN